MKRIDLSVIANRYNNLKVIIDTDDYWHQKTKQKITSFINTSFKEIQHYENLKILNAGSAGYSYGLIENNITHVDIAENHIKDIPNSIVADIENLPFENSTFDIIICVGSVINYCDPISVLREFRRVLSPNGILILEFECSRTFELLLKKEFNKDAVFIETFFDVHGDKESIWYFSEKYITRLIESFGSKAIIIERFHILSPLIYRITKNINYSSKYSKWDKALSYIPILNKFCSNLICKINF